MLTPQETARVIKNAGGTSKFGKLVGATRQRVHNWRERGLPARVMLEHLDTINVLRAKRKRQ